VLVTSIGTLLKQSYSSSGHEVRPTSDLFRPQDFDRPEVPLMVTLVFVFRWVGR
jgi:hypothetical protein